MESKILLTRNTGALSSGESSPPAFLKEPGTEENNAGYMRATAADVTKQRQMREQEDKRTHAGERAGQARMYQGPEARAGHESLFPMPLMKSVEFHVTKNLQ